MKIRYNFTLQASNITSRGAYVGVCCQFMLGLSNGSYLLASTHIRATWTFEWKYEKCHSNCDVKVHLQRAVVEHSPLSARLGHWEDCQVQL